MQLLCRYDVNDFASWKEHFDADTEAQRDAGLSLLQIWQEHDTPSRVFCLFEVNDLDKARDKLLAGLTRAFEPEQLGTRNGLPAPQADFEPYQAFYVARQRQLTAGLQPVRARLRGALADCGPEAARLAELDAVFDATLTAWARRCFGAIPKLLARRFDALKPDEQRSLLHDDADDPQAWMAPGGWLHRFCQEMQLLLLAELEARLEPPRGLLDALHNEVRDRT